jgi:aspartyl-tRNA(Asn)/glutamyl-tRNA(Gln) amidotransferase subunit B
MTTQNKKYETIIGLEVHTQLNTKTKLFCSCPVVTLEPKANESVCPVCSGQPGALPVLNERTVEKSIKAALALKCKINESSVFARKNYFYPDLPKGYQISQYEYPLASNGRLSITIDGKTKDIGITRVHMEEDAGKLVHEIGSQQLPSSLVDLNRCGVPLIEIVSEPDMRSPQDAYEYLTMLKATMQWIDVSGCNMEKGELRVDVNISLRPVGREKFGTKVEIKNLNSFKAVKDALTFEEKRQAKALDEGEPITHDTRLWDEKNQKTVVMRTKEQAHDYRYFPDPDLVPLEPSKDWVDRIKDSLPELPSERKARLVKNYGLSDYDAGVLTGEREIADYFETAAKGNEKLGKPIVNWITTYVLGKLNAEKRPISKSAISPKNLVELVVLIEDGKISVKMAKDVFEKMWSEKKSAKDIVSESGMSQVSDKSQLETWAKEAISANEKAVSDFKSGNEKAIGALVGMVMKKSKGKANPALANSIIKELIKG